MVNLQPEVHERIGGSCVFDMADFILPMRLAWQQAEPLDTAVLVFAAVFVAIVIGESIYQWCRGLIQPSDHWTNESNARVRW